MTRPLDTIVVLSLAEQYPGPYATLLMADLGADVILIERPTGGDPARQFPGFFAALNRNKRSVTLDLKSAGGRDALLSLARRADVLLEGFRPKTMDRLGLGYEVLAAINPRLVYASVSGFGQDGPYRDRPAHDLSYQAITGLFFRQARAGQPAPEIPDVAIGDLSAGMFTAFGVLAAIIERSRTGRGCYVDVSMTDGLVSWMTALLAPIMNGQTPVEFGAEPGYGMFACGDGKLLTLSVAHEDWFWRPLCCVMGLDAADLNHAERLARAADLKRRLADALRTQKRDHWGKLFDRNGIPWAPVSDLTDVVADAHFRSRQIFRQLLEANGKSSWHVSQPLSFGRERPGPTRPAPGLGEHTLEVLRQFGLSAQEIAAAAGSTRAPK